MDTIKIDGMDYDKDVMCVELTVFKDGIFYEYSHIIHLSMITKNRSEPGILIYPHPPPYRKFYGNNIVMAAVRLKDSRVGENNFLLIHSAPE